MLVNECLPGSIVYTGWEVRLLALVGLISRRGWIDAGKFTS